MFNIKNVIGWIGNAAVIPTKDGRWIVEWHTGKRMFVRCTDE